MNKCKKKFSKSENFYATTNHVSLVTNLLKTFGIFK